MKKIINKFLIFLSTFLLLIYLRLYLSFFGFGNFVKLIKKKRTNMLNINKILSVIKSIEITSSIIPNITCMIRAAALKIIFCEITDLKIFIGINADNDISFESHAWVVHNDRVILNNDLKINSYKIIYKI